MDSGFGDDEAYNVYDQAWRAQGSIGSSIYRPTKNAGGDIDYERLAQGNRFVSERAAGASTSGGLTGPVQFEKRSAAPVDDQDDPFGAGLDDFFKQALKNKRTDDKDRDGDKDAKRRRRE
jgi:SNW domain-containing protein 1